MISDILTKSKPAVSVSSVKQLCSFCCDQVVYHAIVLLLAWSRGIARFDLRIQKRGGVGFHNKLLGRLDCIQGTIYGMGMSGFAGFVSGISQKGEGALGRRWLLMIQARATNFFDKEEVMRVKFESIFQESDFISIHAPRTPETFNLVS
jgi:phosphoglycerate dehydrogenase-like enzyme